MNAGYLKRKENGVEKRFYPITHIDAVVNEDGTTIGEQITELNSRVQNIEENGTGGSATEAEDSKKLGGQLPSYYATADHEHTAEEIGARPDTWMPTAGDVGAIPSNNVLIFQNVVADSWILDPLASPDYPYSCSVICEGITPSHCPEVIFGMTEAISGNYAPVAESFSFSVLIYSKVNTAITIPTIKCVKAV